MLLALLWILAGSFAAVESLHHSHLHHHDQTPSAPDESTCLVCTLAVGLLQPATPVRASGPPANIAFVRPLAPAELILANFPLYNQHERAPPTVQA